MLPSLATWLYFVAVAGLPPAVVQFTFAAAKIVQFALPLFWVLIVQRERFVRPVFSAAGLAEGFGIGLFMMAIMLGVYYSWLQGATWLMAAGGAAAQKVAGFGIRSGAAFAMLGVFYSAVHSLLEEYYWRWFVFGQMRRLMPLGLAIVISSLAFAAHHVIVLAVYFGPLAWPTLLFSLGVAAAGAAWAWLYQHSGTLLGPWLSHLLADAAIFLIGYDLLQRTAGF
jgi:membrane protease YdiL (CAAX protease family)